MGMLREPASERLDLLKILRSDSVAKRLLQHFLVLLTANLPLVGGRKNEI